MVSFSADYQTDRSVGAVKMLRVVSLFISTSWLVAFAGCAGERLSSGLKIDGGDPDAVGMPHTLVFSAIEPAPDGSGDTTVSVKLTSGNVPVTDGDLSKIWVTLKYRVSSAKDHDCHEEFNDEKCFVAFANGRKRLQRGATTFNVRLKAGEDHQLRVEPNDADKKDLRGESGIFSVRGKEDEDIVDDSP